MSEQKPYTPNDQEIAAHVKRVMSPFGEGKIPWNKANKLNVKWLRSMAAKVKGMNRRRAIFKYIKKIKNG